MTAQDLYKTFIDELLKSIQIRNHGFRIIQIGTFSQSGPQIRSVVLRHFESQPVKIYFHTHKESAKILEIKADARTAVHAYCSRLEKQIRFLGHSQILTSGAVYDLIVRTLSPAAKELYLDRAKENLDIAVVEFVPESVDALWLRAEGHLRIQGVYLGNHVSLEFVPI